jgi:hypothetical protein
MTPQQLKDNAYNEALNAFIERHGECQATRDEAYERCDKIVNLAKLCFDLAKGMDNDIKAASDNAQQAACHLANANYPEGYLIGCVVAVEAEGK